MDLIMAGKTKSPMETSRTFACASEDYLTGIIYQMKVSKLLVFLLGICLFTLAITACNQGSQTATSTNVGVISSDTSTYTSEPSVTPIPPSATPAPLAIVINGEDITLAEYQAEMARYEASADITGTILAPDTNTIVINELLDQTLLAQGAREIGFEVDDALLEAKISALQEQLGGAQALADWQTTHGYTEADFNKSLKRSIEAAWMRDTIMAEVPETAEEVHVFQILVPTSAEADEVYASLQAGEDFMTLAATYEPLTKGDLGWFPRGYIDDPAIEEAAFALQPDQYSQVIHTEIGYHILYLMEKEPNHPLQPDARRALQEKAIQEWVNNFKGKSEIQILVP
jgi:peptidyl-prolyl cis-trans isomerase C